MDFVKSGWADIRLFASSAVFITNQALINIGSFLSMDDADGAAAQFNIDMEPYSLAVQQMPCFRTSLLKSRVPV